MNKPAILPVVILLMLLRTAMAQGDYCAVSEPFCTGIEVTYPAGTAGTAEPGAYYACLQTQPAPAWFHMVVEDPGNITIYMFSTPLVDIDFICWGPFTDPFSPCVAGLTADKVVDCSYSPNPTEFCEINGAQAGEYYILMITNYSQDNTEITFTQSSGWGSLDCDIVTGLNPGFYATPVEGAAPLEVQFTDQSGGNPVQYKWDFQDDGSYDAFEPDPSFTYTLPGIYSVKLWVTNPYETDSVIYAGYIHVSPDPLSLPDLVVQGQDVSPDTLQPGGSIEIYCSLYNQGFGNAANSEAGYYLSADTLLNMEEDQALGADTTGYLAWGQLAALADTLLIPHELAIGDYYILLVADAGGVIEETDEGNNLEYVMITVDSTTGIHADEGFTGAGWLKIYPNPAREMLHVDYSGAIETPESLEVINACGEVVSIMKHIPDQTGVLVIDIRNLPAGLYLLRTRFSHEIMNKIIIFSR